MKIWARIVPDSPCAEYMGCRWDIGGCHSGALAGPAISAASPWPWGKPVSIRSLWSAGHEHSGAHVCRERSGLCRLVRPWSISQRGSRRHLDEIGPGCDRSVYSDAHHGKDGAIYAGTFRGGVFRSRDRGKSWQAINSGLKRLEIKALLAVSDGVYAGTSDGVYRLAAATAGRWSRPVSTTSWSMRWPSRPMGRCLPEPQEKVSCDLKLNPLAGCVSRMGSKIMKG